MPTDKELQEKVLAMDEPTMNLRFNELRSQAKNKVTNPDGLEIEELIELNCIFARMRGKSAGPPAAGTVRKRARVNDDLSDIL